MSLINRVNLLTTSVAGKSHYQRNSHRHQVHRGSSADFVLLRVCALLGCRIPTKAAADFYEKAGTTAWPRTGQPWEQWDKIWKNYIDVCGDHTDFYSIHLYDWPSWHGPDSTPGKGHIRTVPVQGFPSS